jgi:hypothetical protein
MLHKMNRILLHNSGGDRREEHMKRVGNLTLAGLLGIAVWYWGPGLRVSEQQAFAQAVGCRPTTVVGGITAALTAPIHAACFDAYKLSYFDVSTAFTPSVGGYGGPGSSGGSGDALLRIVNAGNFSGLDEASAADSVAIVALDVGGPQNLSSGADAVALAEPGAVCANIYVYNDVQELQECCSCPLTPNSLLTFSVINDLTSNPLNQQESLSAGVIKIVGSRAVNGCSNAPGAVTAATFSTITAGLHEWINHTETVASNQASFTPSFGFVTSTSVDEFSSSTLDAGELANLQTGCAAINAADRTGTQSIGICRCGLGD